MNRIFRIALSGAAVLVAASGLSAQAKPSRDILPFKATETTLPNGLKVIVVPTGFPNIVSLQIPVQTGSRNEVEEGKSGFAHFFEHIMFKGSKEMNKDRANKILTAAGARENAYTTDDFTNYYITFAKEDLETMLKLQAERFQRLEYSEAEFKTEARAVLGEYNKNASNPTQKLFETMRDNAFSTHTYKHTTMGFIRDIEDMPNEYAYSKTFFDRWYRPERATIIVAGDVDPKKVLPLIQKYWGDWKQGTYTVDIPAEPAGTGPKYVHVNWDSPTSPYLAVAFRNAAFSEISNENAALDMVATLYFGPTSELYKRLVQREQKVDFVSASNTSNADPELFTVFARVKKPEDATYVRDAILTTLAQARTDLVSAQRLEEAKSNVRYGFVRSLDNTDRIASTLARYVRYSRSYNTINRAYDLYDKLQPADLRGAAAKYFTDTGLLVTTLSNKPLPADIGSLPAITSFVRGTPEIGTMLPGPTIKPVVAPLQLRIASAAERAAIPLVIQRNQLPQVRFKLLFNAGSAADPAGKAGLAALSAATIANSGSQALTLEQINALLYPIAGSFGSQVDKEMTTFTGSIHRDNWRTFVDIVIPQLLNPGFRDTDFKRNKDALLNALKQDLRFNNEEELGKERLQTNIFAGTPYAHPVLGTIAGIESITADDVRNFIRRNYTRGNVMLGVNGDVPQPMLNLLESTVAALPAGATAIFGTPQLLAGVRPQGMEVEILEKDTRSTAISFGLPLQVTRSHPDFAALSLARAWLGEHRMSTGRLYDRIREIRGMNYGDYSYIEAFPRGMFQFFPDPNIARRGQIFEIWIRPVVPENAHMALRIAVDELDKLVNTGMSEADFQAGRQYLMKNVFVMTATQDQQLGYAMDSKWYGIPEYTAYMRSALQKLTRDDVNAALKRHLSVRDLSVVVITKDAKGLRDALVADGFSAIKYDGEKSPAILAEDQVLGARKLNISPAKIRITPIAEVFAR